MSHPASARRTGTALLCACGILLGGAAQAATLTVTVSNIGSSEGQVRIAIYNKANWLQEPAFAHILKVAEHVADGAISATFEVPSGEYAVAAYHDENDNGKLDRSFVGMPKEPAGFSNGVVPRFGPPKYEDAAFAVGDEDATARIELSD